MFPSILEITRGQLLRSKKKRDRTASYEDLYYLVTQLADAVDEYENPAVSDLLQVVHRTFMSPPLPMHSSFTSSDLLEETRKYIRGIVSHSLSVLRPVQNHLQLLLDAAADRSISTVEIFTLNHDLLIERTLQSARIPFANGFARVSHDLLCWDHRKFARSRIRVRLRKLHGSVDWYPARSLPRGPSCVYIATNGDIEHANGPDGKGLELLHDRPEILIGTFNKMLEYGMGLYADLFYAFRVSLSHLERLVISGYSFGDKGVNASISEWIRQDAKRRVLIIAPRASQYRRTARGAIRRLFADCATQIITRNKGFEKVTWPEVRDWLKTRG